MAPQSVVSPKMTTPALPMTYDDGKFKKVIQVEKKEKTERRNGRDEGRRKSNQETEGRNAGKDSGEVLTGVELAEEVDWQKHRQEILEEMRKEEEQRQRRIEKRKKLEESWEDPG